VGFSKDEKRRLREKRKSFVMEDGILMHVRLSGTPCRIIASNTERLDIIRNLHSVAVGGSHLGQTTTINQISAQFLWPGMSNDIRKFVQMCGFCQLVNTKKRPVAATFHPIDVQDLFHRWGIDLIGRLNETQRGIKYIYSTLQFLIYHLPVCMTSYWSWYADMVQLTS